MQTAATTADPDDEKIGSIVRSVRFLPEQWDVITTKALALGVPIGKFLRNAALAAAGAPTESAHLRKIADALDGLPAPGAAKAAMPPTTPAKVAAPTTSPALKPLAKAGAAKKNGSRR